MGTAETGRARKARSFGRRKRPIAGTEIKLGADDVLILRESDVLAKVAGDRKLAGVRGPNSELEMRLPLSA